MGVNAEWTQFMEGPDAPRCAGTVVGMLRWVMDLPDGVLTAQCLSVGLTPIFVFLPTIPPRFLHSVLYPDSRRRSRCQRHAGSTVIVQVHHRVSSSDPASRRTRLLVSETLNVALQRKREMYKLQLKTYLIV